MLTSIIIEAGCTVQLNPDLAALNNVTYRDEYHVLMCNGVDTEYYMFNQDEYEETIINKQQWQALPERPERYYLLQKEIDEKKYKERELGIEHKIGSGQGYAPSHFITID